MFLSFPPTAYIINLFILLTYISLYSFPIVFSCIFYIAMTLKTHMLFFCLHLCYIGDFIFIFSLLNLWDLFRLCLHYINKIIVNNTHFQKLQWRLLSSELRFILQNIMASCMWSQCFISIRSIILTGELSPLNIVHFCYFSKISFPPSPFSFFASKHNSASFRHALFSCASCEFWDNMILHPFQGPSCDKMHHKSFLTLITIFQQKQHVVFLGQWYLKSSMFASSEKEGALSFLGGLQEASL